jgi:hypothetical protein
MTTRASQAIARPAAGRPQPISLVEKLGLVAPLAVLQVGVYWLFNHYPVFPSRELPLTWIDRSIPFWIWTIWAYFALIAMAVLLPLLVSEGRVFRRLLRAYWISMGTAWLFFLFLPTHYPRPPEPADNSWPSVAYRSLLDFDSPECCFPSSHVIVPLLACAALRRDRCLGSFWYLLAPWVGICCPSILSTKQHYFWDLLGGAAVAAGGWWLSGWGGIYKINERIS